MRKLDSVTIACLLALLVSSQAIAETKEELAETLDIDPDRLSLEEDFLLKKFKQMQEFGITSGSIRDFIVGLSEYELTEKYGFFGKIVCKNIDGIKGSALNMRGIRESLGMFLGYGQYENIMRSYNGFDNEEPKDLRSSEIKREDIFFPLIVDGLEQEFPENVLDISNQNILDMFNQKGKSLDDYNGKDVVFVTKSSEGKFVLAYYKKGTLFLATQASLGVSNHPTPRGIYAVPYKQERKRSKRYENAAMPYAIQVSGHIFIHRGKVTGNPASHGCVRLPGFYAEILFDQVEIGTPVIIAYQR